MTEAIPKGYKQTEIGEIPEDWSIYNLSEIYDFSSGLSKGKKDFGFGYPFLSYKAVYYNYFVPDKILDLANTTNSERINSSIKRGDVFVTRTSETADDIGVSTVALKDYPNATFNGFAKRLRPKKGIKIFPKYEGYFFRSSIFRRQASTVCSIITRASLSGSLLKKMKVVVPSLEEQKAIGTCLYDLDQFLIILDKLIIKKKNIKKGAMQELLNGKKRLPGFSGEWKTNLFSDLININKGEQINKSELTETGEYPDWNGGIEPSGYTNKWNRIENTITISEGGNSCGFVNYCKQKFWLGGHCYALEIINKTDKIFLYHLLKFKQNSIMALRIGSGLPNIQKKNLNEFELFIPKDLIEQSAIANVLSDMDADIKKLERKRDKYKMIKEGMMQQLLTGRIRLKC